MVSGATAYPRTCATAQATPCSTLKTRNAPALKAMPCTRSLAALKASAGPAGAGGSDTTTRGVGGAAGRVVICGGLVGSAGPCWPSCALGVALVAVWWRKTAARHRSITAVNWELLVIKLYALPIRRYLVATLPSVPLGCLAPSGFLFA